MDTDRLTRFINDPVTSKAVFDTLLAAFIKPTKAADVQTLAAQRIAIDLLHDAFRTLERFKVRDTDTNAHHNPAL